MPYIPEIRIGNTTYKVKDGDLRGSVHPLFLSNHGARTDQFLLESERVTGSSSYIYTITAKKTDTIIGFTDFEVGSERRAQYQLAYSHGSANIGISATSYLFDDQIVSPSTSTFAAFVADRSDYTLKIININSITSDHRVIAVFYGGGTTLLWSFVGFGNNADLFVGVGSRSVNKLNIVNINSPSYGALTLAKDANDVYTLTRNADSFRAYGFSDRENKQIGIGASDNPDHQIHYPFPATLTASSAITGYGVLCLDLGKYDDPTCWQILSIADFEKYGQSLVALAYFYDLKIICFTQIAEKLFTNIIYGNSNNYSVDTAAAAEWYGKINNAIAPIGGSIIFDPIHYTMTFDHVIFAPGSNLGTHHATVQSQTITLDWHTEEHPTWLRAFYYNNYNSSVVCYSTDSYTEELDANALRFAKPGYALICMVYNGKFVYTCGSAQPNQWFIYNGSRNVDIYASAGSAVTSSDLFKAFQKVGVVGDSLSVGYMYNKLTEVATSRMLQYSWPKQVMKDTGVPWLNLGTSGQNVLTWCSNATYGKVQAEASGNKCQAYIIGLGENDMTNTSRGIPLGSPSDINASYSTVATTYYGGYARIIEILKHLNADCKIFCLTNPRTGGRRAEYNEAVRYIVNEYFASDSSIMLVDLEYENASDFNDNGSFLPTDAASITGGHYSASGYARIASIIEKALSNTMEANAATMVNIAYIPYDTGTPTANTMTE